MIEIGIKTESIKKRLRDIAIFRNMTEVSNENGLRTVIHQDDMTMYNGWHLTTYHFVDRILFRGEAKDLPEQYRPFVEKLGHVKNVIVTQSSQDTY
jgi:hypothetical protein